MCVHACIGVYECVYVCVERERKREIKAFFNTLSLSWVLGFMSSWVTLWLPGIPLVWQVDLSNEASCLSISKTLKGKPKNFYVGFYNKEML